MILSHKSGLEAVRILRASGKLRFKNEELNSNMFEIDTNANEDAFLNRLRKPIDILVGRRNFVHKTQQWNLHYHSCRLPYKSFLRLTNNLYIARPALLLCELAKTCSYWALFLLCMEFCGTYALQDNTDTGFVSNLPVLCTRRELRNFCDQFFTTSVAKGVKRLRRVLKFISEGSASPQESILYMRLCASRSEGGYGLRGMTLNVKIWLSPAAQKICGQAYVIVDICCIKTKIAIEYDSRAFHSDAVQNRKDKLRIDALIHDGWKVFSFVDTQMYDIASFDAMARDILKANGQDPRIRTHNFAERQAFLFNTAKR